MQEPCSRMRRQNGEYIIEDDRDKLDGYKFGITLHLFLLSSHGVVKVGI
jgi:hypothetical protein